MTQGVKQRLIFTIFLAIFSLVFVLPTFIRSGLPDWWPASPLRLGLDLKGGSYLVMGVQTPEAVKSQLNAIASSTRAELKSEKIGLIQSKAQSIGDNHLVQFTLLGEKGVERLEQFIAKNYPELTKRNIETSGTRVIATFVLSPTKAAEIEKNAVLQAIETIRNRVDQYGVAEPTIQKVGEKGIMVQLPEITNIDQVKKTIGSVAKLEFRLVANPNTPEDTTITLPSRESGSSILQDEVVMAGDAISTANVQINPQTNEVEVSLRLNSVGKSTFAHITSENVNRQLAIVLDGVVQSAPVIRSAITGGEAQISGSFTKEEAHRLAVVLRSGALPAPLTFEEERTVGASLGADSIHKGVVASLVGSIVVIIFMCVYYKKAGIMAVGCLVLNILLLLALLSMFRATLTLPGLAGLALTVGMAVDANVIIYERIKEELKLGVTRDAAVEAGFLKAHWTILDANLTTLLTGIILYMYGTGPIKGFAVTLSLGILTTIFAALFLSKLGFAVCPMVNKDRKLSI
jgi:preprotein translocase subunit SecD